MRPLLALLFVTACAGCHEPEPQTKPPCVPTEAVLQVGTESTHPCVGENVSVRASFSDGCESRDVTAEIDWTSTAPKTLASQGAGRFTAVAPGYANAVAVRGTETAGMRIVVKDCQ